MIIHSHAAQRNATLPSLIRAARLFAFAVAFLLDMTAGRSPPFFLIKSIMMNCEAARTLHRSQKRREPARFLESAAARSHLARTAGVGKPSESEVERKEVERKEEGRRDKE